MKPTQTCATTPFWIDREDALSTIEKLESTQNCTAEEANWLRDFHRDGYIVWRKVISEEAVAALRISYNSFISSLIATSCVCKNKYWRSPQNLFCLAQPLAGFLCAQFAG